jgi:hypothetical protein
MDSPGAVHGAGALRSASMSQTSPASVSSAATNTPGSRPNKRRTSRESHTTTATSEPSISLAGGHSSLEALEEESEKSRRKLPKVSRACDFCKLKKLRCSGTLPCSVCTKRNIECLYDAQYRRGRPPTPTRVVHETLLPSREARDLVDSSARNASGT